MEIFRLIRPKDKDYRDMIDLCELIKVGDIYLWKVENVYSLSQTRVFDDRTIYLGERYFYKGADEYYRFYKGDLKKKGIYADSTPDPV